MNWNYHQIRRNIWSTCFHRGVRAWLALVAVCFIFAFIGSSNSSQVSFVDTADQLIGTENDLLPGNIDILKEYIVNAPFYLFTIVASGNHPVEMVKLITIVWQI